jgi:hypothetical protein
MSTYYEFTTTDNGTANPAFEPSCRRSQRGVVQAVIDGSNTAYLHGSVNGTDYQLIESFTASAIKEIILPPYLKVSGSASNTTDAYDGNSKVYINTFDQYYS